MGTGHMTVGKKKGQILKVWEVWGEGCVCVGDNRAGCYGTQYDTHFGR